MLVIVMNISLRWSRLKDTPLIRQFMEQMLIRVKEMAKKMDSYHPFLFLSHAYDEQKPLLTYGKESLDRLHQVRDSVDPEGFYQVLQVGHHKLGMRNHNIEDLGIKQEL